jgi:hypothetical protein
MPRALCRGQPDVFDGTSDDDRRTAIGLCGACAEIDRCRAWLAAIPRSRWPVGIVAAKYRPRRSVQANGKELR